MAHCYDLDGFSYSEHFFVRVFWTEVGGGQLYSQTSNDDAPKGLHSLNKEPASYLIDGNRVAFETANYRAPTISGWCGLCEQTGFRITVNENVVWEVPAPETRGMPIFNGTVDMDRSMLRVCEENVPAALGVEIPFEQDYFSARTSILVCKTIDY
ncbi:hypothetical protein ACFFUT_06965 [Pseudohalocynthiibacter aestuariivivens]|uniref:Uncharacterized protein n=2 Tax=Pseudohalocynthiibacter TaxID=1759417 RepID=A0ABV5JDJ4_9RHOB|nr:hypothetical protein [Pseudohalocynthiibacter aestuariivivens]MBS9717929.1 hypothetical protein [Pseudohalocynthiibacter aestuariivivens]